MQGAVLENKIAPLHKTLLTLKQMAAAAPPPVTVNPPPNGTGAGQGQPSATFFHESEMGVAAQSIIMDALGDDPVLACDAIAADLTAIAAEFNSPNFDGGVMQSNDAAASETNKRHWLTNMS